MRKAFAIPLATVWFNGPMKHFDGRLSLQKLDMFCKVITLGGVSKAAEALFVSQPVVSAHLKSLQAHFGIELLERDGRGVRLTEPGQRVFAWASEVLRGHSDLSHELEQLSLGVEGKATLGAGISVGNYLLAELLVEFRKLHPGAQLTSQHLTVESALERLEAGELDYCFVATYESLDADRFDVELLARPSYVLFASPNDSTIPSQLTVEQLAELEFVSPPGGMRIRSNQDFALSTIGVADRRIAMELGSAEALKFAVAQGVGISMLWRVSVQAELDAGTLRELHIDGPAIRDNLYRVQLRGARLTPMQLKLRDFLSRGMRERIAKEQPGHS